ncbi:MAG: NADH-quinone oxidoreductase subunit [Candidatus Binatota bacterium]|nr:NADH-quinone oxidoreductase subunit [Candidatus Binatota bacterium]
MEGHLLSALVFSPLVGAVALGVVGGTDARAIGRTALAFAFVPFVLSLLVLADFDPARGDFQMLERADWIPDFGVQYLVGIDGVSLFLVVLTTLLTVLVVIFSAGDVTRRLKEYMVMMLVLETGMLGTLVALDLFLFYVFWEVMLVPMYLLIGIWGGTRRIYAAVKFALYTMAGSLLMLVAILYLGWLHREAYGSWSFDLLRLYDLSIPAGVELWLFAAFALAFAIKVPLFPLHTWLPDAHVEAPTGGSVILAGVLLKMGTYGFLRFALPLFPHAAAAAAPTMMALAVVGIVYGALVAMVQPDLKKLVAYSSVSHLGFVMLGLFAANVEAVEGAVYQMLSHGLSTGALFLAVGVIYSRRHTREIAAFGGLWKVVPLYSVFLLLAMLSSAGLPGLNGFVGEFLILIGAFGRHPMFAAPAVLGMILGAVYLTWMYQRVIFGPLRHEENRALPDLTGREIAAFAPLIVLFFWMGVYPRPLLVRIEPSVKSIVERIERVRPPASTASEMARVGRPSSARPGAER